MSLVIADLVDTVIRRSNNLRTGLPSRASESIKGLRTGPVRRRVGFRGSSYLEAHPRLQRPALEFREILTTVSSLSPYTI